MKRLLWIVLGLVLAGGLLVQASCAARSGSAGQPTGINVTGEGKVKITPDLAVVNLGVETKALTVAQAQGEAASKMQAIMSALTAKGVAQRDVRTARYTIYPEVRYEDRRQVEAGFRVNNIVTVKIRDTNKAGEILDVAVAAGANRVENISFTMEDTSALEKEAREKAMADARAKAEQLARLSGVSLGRPINISEVGGRIPLEFGVRAVSSIGGDAPTPVSPGEMEIRLTLQVLYEIERGR